MVEFILTSLVIFSVMVGWLYVQDLYRRFAQRHPELGPFRGEGGCDGACSCRQGSCASPASMQQGPAVAVDLPTPAGDPIRLRRDRQ
jgi:hypothetical protein